MARGLDEVVVAAPRETVYLVASKCHPWAAEAQEAVRLLQSVPRDVTVHGGGMIAAILDGFGFGGSAAMARTTQD